jgi:RimJ/RimL family protein N-acetyltransferase
MGLVELPGEVRTARLVLRPVAVGDAERMQQYRGDPVVAAYLTHPPLDLDQAREFVTRAAALWSAADDERFNLLFAVVLDGVVIGDVHAWNTAESLQPASPDPADVWIGYALDPSHQGHGYAAEAVSALADWLFARGARNVFANCYLDNTSSMRLLERLGFVERLRYTAEQDAAGRHATSCRMRLDRRSAVDPEQT